MPRAFLLVLLSFTFSLPALSQDITLAQARILLQQLSAAQPDADRVSVLLQLGKYYQEKPGTYRPDIDSAFRLTEQAAALSKQIGFKKGMEMAAYRTCQINVEMNDTAELQRLFPALSDTNKISLILEEGLHFLETEPDRWKDKLTMLCTQSLVIGRACTDPRMKCMSFELPALYYINFDQGEQGDYYARHCVKFMDSVGDYTAGFEFCDHIIKFASEYHNLHELSLRYGVKALGFAKKTHDSQILTLYQLIIQGYYYDGDLYTALFYGHEALGQIEYNGAATESDHWIYYELAEIYREMGRLDLSLAYCKLGIANIRLFQHRPGGAINNPNRRQSGLMRSQAQALSLGGHARQALDSLETFEGLARAPDPFFPPILFLAMAECYTALKEYDQAKKYFMAALNREGRPTTGDSLRIFLPFARFYIEQQDFKTARPYLERLLRAKENSITPFKTREIYYLLYRTDSAAGNFMSALQHLRQYNVLNDSLFSMAKNGQFEARQLQYVTEAKDRDMQTQARTARTFRNMMVTGTILLLLLLAVLYNRYRLKRRSNRLLEELLAEKNDLIVEKEWLIKEVHHRVKNNLQIVVSLLNMAGRYIDNKDAIRSIRESQDRMQAMSLIHQKLYTSDGIQTVEMAAYVRELVSYLDSNYNATRSIHFRLEVDPISLDSTVAVPVGLILNEAITNTLKHAFPGTNQGTICIAMAQVDPSTLQLSIRDDGIGLSDGLHENKKPSMGMTLMRALTKQLHGSFDLSSEKGLVITILFPLDNSSVSDMS